MTTKELLRRLDAFSSLDLSAYLFKSDLVSFVYHYTCLFKNGKRVSSYILVPKFSFDFELVYLSVEQFSRSSFSIQIKYFKSFYSRCSKSQQDYIKKSMLVDNLLSFIGGNKE